MAYQNYHKADVSGNQNVSGDLELMARAREIGERISGLSGSGNRGEAWSLYNEQPKEIQEIIKKQYPIEFRALMFSAI